MGMLKYPHRHSPELHKLEIDKVRKDSELLRNPLVRCRSRPDMHAFNGLVVHGPLVHLFSVYIEVIPLPLSKSPPTHGDVSNSGHLTVYP